MSIKLMNAVYDNESGNITGSECAFLAFLANLATDNGSSLWPSYDYIAKKIKVHRTTAIKLAKSVIEKGYVIKKRQTVAGRDTSNRYYLNVKRLLKEAEKTTLMPDDENVSEMFEDLGGSSESLPSGVANHYPPSSESLPYSKPTLKQRNNNNGPTQTPTLEPSELKGTQAFVAAVVKGEKKKVSNGREFVFEAETDEVIIALGRIDISNTQAVMLIQKYGRPRVLEALEMTKEKATANPAGYLRQALIGEWKPKKEVAPKRVTTPNTAVLETQKMLEAMDAREKQLERSQVNVEAHIAAARAALRRPPT